MTISNTAVSATVIGNGSQTVFNYGFLIPAGASYVLQQIDTSGNVTTIPTTAYSVSGVGSATGGTFTYSPGGGAVPAGYQLIFTRLVPFQQLTSLANQSAYYPASVEAALDWLEMQIQQLVNTIGLSGAGMITFGAGAPTTLQPNGSLYLRTDGATGSRLYVSTGAGWNAVPGV